MLRRTLILALLVVFAPATPAVRAVPTPVIASNFELLATLPDASPAISLAFSYTTPHVYVSTLKALQVYDITNPALPVLTGVLPLVNYENESMSVAERPNGDRFVLIGSTLASVTPAGEVNTTSAFLMVVDVTDAASPQLVATLKTASRTHTVTCVNRACPYAVSDGRAQGKMSVIDLRDWRHPTMATTYESLVPLGHDDDQDAAGVLWHVGGQGSVALDVRDPLKPVPLASTNGDGLENADRTGSPWNNFIHHNSLRPNARAFRQTKVRGRLTSGAPDVRRGNVLLVTEEDVSNGPCGDSEGSFQTWHVPYLDAAQNRKDNPDGEAGRGQITPLDRWNTELLDSGTPTPAGTECSAHYFDYRDGFVVQAWYGQGVRLLDVRDARDIKQVGYYFTGASQAWATYFVPPRFAKGDQLVYLTDELRGFEVLRVTLPNTAPAQTTAVRAPVLPQWLDARRTIGFGPSPDFGWACRVPTL